MQGCQKTRGFMIVFAALGLILVLSTLGCRNAAEAEAEAQAQRAPIRARDFANAIGMNTKFKDVGSLYDDVQGSIQRLLYLGVKLMREGFPASELTQRQLRGYHAFANAGGRFTFVTHNEKPIPQMVADIAAFERAHPGSVKAVEGPNELNNWPITYNGVKGTAAAKTYMADLYAAVKADPTLSKAGVLVYGATDWPPTATMADRANLHSYERNAYGSHERLRLDWESTLQAFANHVVSPPGEKPRWVVTETGYHTWIGSGWFEGVDPPTQAKYGLMLLLNVAELGGEEVQWYLLQDGWGMPKNGEEAFGVFDFQGQPKPLAVAIHNLMALLDDSSPEAKTFAPQPRRFTLSGNLGRQPHDGVYRLLMQKSDGQYVLAVWREGELWDAQADRALPLAPQMTAVELAEPVASVEIYDPIAGTSPVQGLQNTARIELQLADHPLILVFR